MWWLFLRVVKMEKRHQKLKSPTRHNATKCNIVKRKFRTPMSSTWVNNYKFLLQIYLWFLPYSREANKTH